MSIKEGKVGFEQAFDFVGGRGRFQWLLLLAISLHLIFLTWNHLGYIFIGAVPIHWCKVGELKDVNWTANQIKEFSIPKIGNGRNDSSDVWKFDSCHYYDFDYAAIAEKFKGNYEGAYELMFRQSSTGESTATNYRRKECSAWNYDGSIYSSTVVTQFDLVCGRRYLAATIQSTYMVGGLAGTLIFGALNDRVLGRRNSALISIILVLLGGFAASLSKSYWLFVFIRLFIAIGTAGCMQAASLSMLEHCDIDSRARFYSIAGGFFGVGYALMPIYAYFIRDWSHLQLAFSSTTLILLSYYWIFPESPRWLASMGHDDRAVAALENIASINRKPKPDKSQLLRIVQSCHKHHPDEENAKPTSNFMRKFRSIISNIKSLVDSRESCKRTFTVWLLFILVAFVYYGGLMEIPACIAPIPFLAWWGRRPTTVICYLCTGICAIAVAATPPEYETARVIFMMGGKFFIAAAFNVIYLVIAEVYPTVCRSTGQSAGTIMGRFGSISAPYVADLLTTVYPDLPCLIFGIVSIIGAAVATLLPEMKDMEMMDQVSELEMELEQI